MGKVTASCHWIEYSVRRKKDSPALRTIIGFDFESVSRHGIGVSPTVEKFCLVGCESDRTGPSNELGRFGDHAILFEEGGTIDRSGNRPPVHFDRLVIEGGQAGEQESAVSTSRAAGDDTRIDSYDIDAGTQQLVDTGKAGSSQSDDAEIGTDRRPE